LAVVSAAAAVQSRDQRLRPGRVKEPLMPVEKGEAREFNVRQVLPWTEIFRAFSIALDPSKLILATIAVVLIWFSWWLLSLIFVQDNKFGEWPANVARGKNPYTVLKEDAGSLFTADFWLSGKTKN
jgi:hypothetical protein